MAKKAKKIKTSKGLKLAIVNPNAAGIDVSSTEMQVSVPQDRDGESNRRFGTFTEDLHQISDWLKACRIDTVAMESTGVYWVQLYMILEGAGFDVLLVNAKAIKNIGEKKTDQVDAETIMLLHSYGLLKASRQTIAKSLQANWDEDLLLMLKQSYGLYLNYQELMQDCDRQIEAVLKNYLEEIQPDEAPKPCAKTKKSKARKNAVTIDAVTCLLLSPRRTSWVEYSTRWLN